MRLKLATLVAAGTLLAGCLDLPLEDWERGRWGDRRTPESRTASARPGSSKGDERDPRPPTVLVLPEGSTNFTHVESYYPAWGFGLNGYYSTGWANNPGYWPSYGYAGGYGGDPSYGAYGYGFSAPYAGGVLRPGYGYGLGFQRDARQGGGSRYYPGSGRSYGLGQPRHSSGIYGGGTLRQGGTPPSRFSSYR